MERTADLTEKNIFQTYSRYPVTLAKGKGSRAWDETGKEYLDFLSCSYLLASLIAASFASAPLLQKNILSAKELSIRSSASFAWGSV